MRFDYLHDAQPEFVARARSMRIPRRLHTVAAAFAMMMCVMLLASGVEAFRLNEALAVERRAEMRFERSRAALAGARLESRQLDTLVAQDRRLRQIRLSGALEAAQLARTGNLFPRRAWLESITSAASDRDLRGRAENLAAFDTLLERLIRGRSIGQPHSIRIVREERGPSGMLSFELQLGAAP